MSNANPLGTFVGEARDLLSDVDEQILLLESGSESSDAVNSLFRALHTLKGSGACVGLNKFSELAHNVEDLASGVRDGKAALSGDLIDTMLAATDILKVMVDLADQGDSEMLEVDGYEQVVARLASATSDSGATMSHRYELELEFDEGISELEQDPLELIETLSQVGELETVETQSKELPPLKDLKVDTAYLKFRIVLRTSSPESDIWHALGLATIGNTISILRLPEAANLVKESTPAKKAPSGPTLVAGPSATLRVSTGKLDGLLNEVGDLILNVARAEDVLSNPNATHAERHGLLESLRSVSRLLQQTALDLRMIPLAPTFKSFERTVRDLSRQLNKDVRLELQGASTEVDKTMIEKVADPLRHLVRNALDHGLEDAEGRKQAGKPEQAVIVLAARQQGSDVIVEVRDDGRGIDPEIIRKKAVERGVLEEGRELDRSQLLDFLFHPGFSTASEVTDVSGRGVGLDVVRQNVESLGGTVTLESELGIGTTFRLSLPLSLMIVTATIARVGSERYSIPTTAIREQLRRPVSDLRSQGEGAELIDLRGDLIPVLGLRSLFEVEEESDQPQREVVIVLDHGGRSYGVIVDDIEAQQQIVIKSLEKNYFEVPGFSGVTTLGTGHLSLVLDPTAIGEHVFREAEPECGRLAG